MESDCLIPGCLSQCADHIQVCDCRILDRSIFPARPLSSYRTGCNDQIAALYLCFNAAAGSDADKRMRTRFEQLFHRNRRRGTADTCRGHRNGLALQRSGIRHKFPAVRNQNRMFKICGDFFTPFRVSRQNDIFSNLPVMNLQMILHFFFRIVHTDPPFRTIFINSTNLPSKRLLHRRALSNVRSLPLPAWKLPSRKAARKRTPGQASWFLSSQCCIPPADGVRLRSHLLFPSPCCHVGAGRRNGLHSGLPAA